MTDTIRYEFPLNERIRIFCRLELLFEQLAYFSADDSVFSRRAAVTALLDILTIFSRNDLKSEVLKELERQIAIFNQWLNAEGVDGDKVSAYLAQLKALSQRLYSSNGKIGLKVMANDLFQSVSQRSAIPGGTCSFDLPAYHFWLEQPSQMQQQALDQWLSPFADIREGIALALSFIRQSGVLQDYVAEAGFMQMGLDRSQPIQMIQVCLAQSMDCYAEISGGKHRFTVRFMRPGRDGSRAAQAEQNIPFKLSFCQF
ncbi:MAG: cell division protein ZapD [Methylococcales bacterium]|nr:cell division protein ZapD [Methylococcales bacterium]